MRKTWLIIVFFIFYPLSFTILLGGDPPPHPPIDGGTAYLLTAGLVYGIYHLSKKKS